MKSQMVCTILLMALASVVARAQGTSEPIQIELRPSPECPVSITSASAANEGGAFHLAAPQLNNAGRVGVRFWALKYRFDLGPGSSKVIYVLAGVLPGDFVASQKTFAKAESKVSIKRQPAVSVSHA